MIKKYNADEAGDINKDLEYGVRLDPDFFESYLPIAWTFLDDKPRHLDPIRREMIMLGILAYKGRREEVYSHTKRPSGWELLLSNSWRPSKPPHARGRLIGSIRRSSCPEANPRRTAARIPEERQ